jgi:hypothetical protein
LGDEGLDNYEKLEIKLDTMNETMRSMLDLNRQTLTEIKKQGDVFMYRLEAAEKKIEKAADSRKEIYERLEKIEQHCAVRETAIPIAGHQEAHDDFNVKAKTLVTSTVGKTTLDILKYVGVVIGGMLLMKILEAAAKRIG